MKQFISILSIYILAVFSTNAQNIECIGNTIQIPLTGYKYGNIKWQFSSDGSTWTELSGATQKDLVFVIAETGYFRAKITDGICEYFSDTTYIQAFPANSASAGDDINRVNVSTTVALEGNVPTIGTGVWTIKSGTGGVLSDPASPKSAFTGIQKNKYVLTWTLTSDCNTSSDDVAVNFYDPDHVVSDVDGNYYNTVTIGFNEWMAENLKTTKYRNGEPIPTKVGSIQVESNPKYQWPYLDDESKVAVYGRLYTWFTAKDSRGLCPTGWYIPSGFEWEDLSNTLGGQALAGGKMKETGTEHWTDPNVNATNESGFTALPAGYRNSNGNYYFLGTIGGWWSSDGDTWTESTDWYIYNTDGYLNVNSFDQTYGISIRCVK